ncbi:RNA exonuclease 5 isoform X2 [Hyla sarda]|uniref:RNA exonuclease 5 isoform X2 n=1 Tax=Hyla sarda TaxID=327740 RepID=UPI0024C43EB6|nr:RNA exonuclease 5 isoform X2 [Hyla sarda]
MGESKSMIQHKRALCNDDEEEPNCKKRRDEIDRSQEATNGLDLQRAQKAPRLSPALFCDNCEIPHLQLHQLLKYAVIGKKGKATQASWCSIHHQKRLRRVVLVVLQDFAQHHFYQYYLHFQFLRRLFRHRFSLPPTPSDIIASIIGLNDLKVQAQKEKINGEHSTEGSTDQKCDCLAVPESCDPILQKYGRKKHGLTRYLLTEEQMRKYEYPLVGSSDTQNYVHTNCIKEPTDSSPLFGLDCEMCLTCKGNELTRVSLVDAQGQCIMNELVKPDNPIINYMTRFSGITRKMLFRVNTKLKDVQEKLKSLLPPDAVLVGHSLNCDLQALQMIHPNVIDTSLLFTRNLERRFRLKFLAQVILKREIQSTDAVGHDSTEDATAALNLAQYFIEHGPEKVADINMEDIFRQENCLHSRLSTPKSPKNGFPHSPLPSKGPSFLEELDKAVQKIAYVSRVGLKDPVPSSHFEAFLCTSDEEVLRRACSIIPQSPFSIVNFQDGSISNTCLLGTNAKVNCKFADMMTIFAGPFKSGMCLKSVKIQFESCGPIHSLSTISETQQPYICIKYSVPEAAQLAVELLNGSCIDGCHIKVQRMITQQTLDHEDIFKEMEDDPENKNTIYVSGFERPLTEEFLQQQFQHFKEIKSVFVPTNPRSQQPVKYCYLKFHSPDAAAAAIEHMRTHGGLRIRKAITSTHLHRWLQAAVNCVPPHKHCNQEVAPEEHSKIIRDLDRKIEQLYESTPENSLCVILFTGNNSSGSLPGFGLMGIKC